MAVGAPWEEKKEECEVESSHSRREQRGEQSKGAGASNAHGPRYPAHSSTIEAPTSALAPGAEQGRVTPGICLYAPILSIASSTPGSNGGVAAVEVSREEEEDGGVEVSHSRREHGKMADQGDGGCHHRRGKRGGRKGRRGGRPNVLPQ